MVSVLTAVRDLGRLREISAVLVRHGFGEIVARAGFGRTKKSDPPSDAPEIPSEDLGPSFIKLGQIASTRGDVLPPDLITELKKLQDDVPGVGFDEIKAVIET